MSALRRVAEAITGAPYRLQIFPPEGTVDLAPQVGHVLVDHVRGAVEGEVPDVLEETGPAEDLAGGAHEELEKSKLLGGEVEFGLPPPGPAAARVEAQVTNGQHGGPLV